MDDDLNTASIFCLFYRWQKCTNTHWSVKIKELTASSVIIMHVCTGSCTPPQSGKAFQVFWLLTLSSLIFSTLVRKSSSRLVQASLWLSEVRAKKYATASLHTLRHTDKESTLNRKKLYIYINILWKKINSLLELCCSVMYYSKTASASLPHLSHEILLRWDQ